MASLNKAMIIGTLGKDPEVRYTAGGTAVASFSVATSDRIKGKDGNWEEKTEWHTVTLWARLAEIAGEFLSKGKSVYIEGRLLARKKLQEHQIIMIEQKIIRRRGKGYVDLDTETRLTLDDMENIFFNEFREDPPSVTPYGAGVVLSLYRKGHLPLSKKTPGEVPAELMEYAKSREKGPEWRARLEKEREEKLQAYRGKLLDLPGIDPERFSYSLLNDVFFLHVGAGNGTLEIGGLKVSKVVIPYSSNSGKSRDHEVTFRWTDKAGVPQEIVKDSIFSGNRRNDADRNWGLPE